MKHFNALALGAVLAFAGAAANAGSLTDPVVEAPLIVADATNSSSGGTTLVALLAILLAIPVATD